MFNAMNLHEYAIESSMQKDGLPIDKRTAQTHEYINGLYAKKIKKVSTAVGHSRDVYCSGNGKIWKNNEKY